YAGVADPERMKRSLAAVREPFPSDTVPIGSPYFYFFYLAALRRAGMHQEALDVTRSIYGRMLDAGATTWWEHLTGHASLSHGWSTAPNFDLSTYVLGVEPTEPGFVAFRVEPQPASLRWARGIIPAVGGDIQVEWHQDAGQFELRVQVPMPARVELSVPARDAEGTLLEPPSAERKEFHGGRVRLWVRGPGSFRVRSVLEAPRRSVGDPE
ncbi:MAG: alpha-L-rhamnosidase C-terminal domain-containing protein, partial [Candidatus Rokuibacteriota bacterium]